MGIISITSCQGLPMRDLIPLSTDKWLTNNWPMTDRYCAISYQFFWLESLFLVILDCKSILVLLIYWFYEIFPSISIFNNVFILFFRCCCNKYVTGVKLLYGPAYQQALLACISTGLKVHLIGGSKRALEARLLSDQKGPPINRFFWPVYQLVFRATWQTGLRGP